MRLEKAITDLKTYQQPAECVSIITGLDPAAIILVTVSYLICLLSIPLLSPDRLIWLAAYPIVLSPLAGQTYSSLFLKSLIVLPVLVAIGIFNPFIDRKIAFMIGTVAVSTGWVTFISILIRGLLAMQALLLMIRISGLREICGSLGRLGLPKVLTTQILLLYRFFGVLLEEAVTIQRSAISRGYGHKAFPLKLWTRMIGSLMLRSLDRAKRIHNAMLSRGFDGTFPTIKRNKWKLKDTVFCVVCLSLIIFLRTVDLSGFIK